MSVNGPSALGTLLVQRIDAMLGTTLSQQANLVSGARPDAVSQPGNPQRPDATGNQVQRDPQEAVDRTRAQNENPSRAGVERGKLDPRTAEALLGRNAASTLTTPSAPTRLGFAAQTILALLAAYPDQNAAVQGRRPLLTSPPGTGGQQAGSAGQTAGSANTGNAQVTAGNAGAGGSQLNTPVQGVQGQAGNGASGAGNAAGGAAAGQAAGRPGVAGTTAPPNPVSGLNTAGAAALRAVAGTGNATPAMVGQLANALSQALQTSGMFYESHLGNLAFGRTPASQIQQEPQAQITQNQNAGSASSSATTSANATGNNPSGGQAAGAPGAQNPAAAQAASQAGSALANAASSNAAATRGAQPTLTLNGLDPQTHTLVRQQLEVLANQTFSWRGEVWPDTPMDWEIARREAWKELDGTEHPEHWATRLTLTLPNLGEVQARLTLAGDQLVMHLVSPESFGLLSQHTEELRARYRAQGLQLSQLSVAAFDNVGARDLQENTGVAAGEQRAAAGVGELHARNSEIDRDAAGSSTGSAPQEQSDQQQMAGTGAGGAS